MSCFFPISSLAFVIDAFQTTKAARDNLIPQQLYYIQWQSCCNGKRKHLLHVQLFRDAVFFHIRCRYAATSTFPCNLFSIHRDIIVIISIIRRNECGESNTMQGGVDIFCRCFLFFCACCMQVCGNLGKIFTC